MEFQGSRVIMMTIILTRAHSGLFYDGGEGKAKQVHNNEETTAHLKCPECKCEF